MMEPQQNARRIGRFVPSGMVWGSKTGSCATLVHDAGYIRTAEGSIIVAAFAQDVPDVLAGEMLVSEMVRALF